MKDTQRFNHFMFMKFKNTNHHSMAWEIEPKLDGRDLKKLCIDVNASIAVPSTTSITPNPHKFDINDAALTATAPPILWPTRITGSFSVVAFTIAATSLVDRKTNQNVDIYI